MNIVLNRLSNKILFFCRFLEKSQFVVFSDYALIAPRNNKLTLTFRIGNLSLSQLIFANVRLLMIRQRRTREGEVIPHQIYDMEITHLRNGQLFFPRPTVVEHIIDSRSPLHGIQRGTLQKEHFEIIAIIEGSFDYTGFSCHFRTSYLPSELLWGYQFCWCQSTLRGFDYQKFNSVELIAVQPIWNYDEENPTTPTSPETSPLNVRRNKNLLSPPSTANENNFYPRLQTIDSIPSDIVNLENQESEDSDDVLPIVKIFELE